RRATDLRRVCSRWHKVFDGTPVLWTRLCSAPSHVGQEHLLQYVRQSGALGLAIFHLQKRPSSFVLSELFSVLAPYSERWMELFIRASWRSMAAGLPTLTLPILRKVTLMICGIMHKDGLQWLAGASALSSLTLLCGRTLPNLSAVVTLPLLPNLEFLEIDGLLGVSKRCMLQPLRTCPRLQCLRLHAFHHQRAGSSEDVDMVELPVLRQMHLDGDAAAVLAFIVAPALDELVIACVHDGSALYRNLSAFLSGEKGAPHLQTLELTNVFSGFPAAAAEFVRCLYLLGSLRFLRVNAYSPSHLGGTDLFSLLTCRESVRVFLPKLTTLRYKYLLRSMSVRDRDAWERMKVSRSSATTIGNTRVSALEAVDENDS
ncbi:hypothetical protein EV121DRAFT_219109, partial [Schizophyllum commune]